MLNVQILKTNKKLRVQEGEIYTARTSFVDPSKLVILARHGDKFRPYCQLNREDVRMVPAPKKLDNDI